jgi:flagellar hook-basal body complex protein FliE
MGSAIGAAASRLSGTAGSVSAPGTGKIPDQLFRDLQGARGITEATPQGGDTGIRQVPVFPTDERTASFGDTLKRALNEVSAQQETAADTLSAFLRGEDVELHQVMAATEEAQISLQMLIEVRNKFMEAYRTLSNMQG